MSHVYQKPAGIYIRIKIQLIQIGECYFEKCSGKYIYFLTNRILVSVWLVYLSKIKYNKKLIEIQDCHKTAKYLLLENMDTKDARPEKAKT